jgi:RNA polymerase sigma-70 factor (ECF subfamily)
MANAEPVALRGAPYSVPSDATHLPYHDSEQLGVLLRGLEPRLTALALRFTRDADSARDVVQNAFEKALRHGHAFRGKAKVSTWLHRIVANEAMMWLRSERRRSGRAQSVADLDTMDFVDRAPSAPEQLERHQRRERVRAGVRRLKPQERDVVLQCVLADRSYAQFGAEAGVHPAAVKTRAFRARRKLGRILGDV